MIQQTFKDIFTEELAQGAIINDEFTGFLEDYLVLHCLIRKYKPKTFFELGTNMGTGTQIICNAGGADMKVFSLDLPPEQAHISLQSPGSEGKGAHKIGSRCTLPFTQILCNSLEYDYPEKCEGWFIDGEHVYDNVLFESTQAFKQKPKLVVWHDSDIPEVWKAIAEVFDNKKGYYLYRVTDTRIAYAVKK